MYLQTVRGVAYLRSLARGQGKSCPETSRPLFGWQLRKRLFARRDGSRLHNLLLKMLLRRVGANIFSDVPNLQGKHSFHDKGLGVGLRVINGKVKAHGIVVHALITLHEMQSFRVRETRPIHPGLVIKANRVDNKGISVPPANRMSPPRGFKYI